MLPIHIPMKKPKLSSIKRLVEYITDTQNKEHRIANVRITNCVNDYDVNDAIEHMQDIQILNKTRRTKKTESETTYHLVVSFNQDEKPSIEVLNAIEDRLCDALGYEEHQRVSAFHVDTDNPHLHIAINKIHPKTHNIHDPYRDYLILAKTCIELEKQYGLIPDNHTPKHTVDHGNIKSIEAKTGIKSLLTYVQENCLEQLQKAQSWTDIHQDLGKYGLEIKLRGNGLVIIAKDKNNKPIKGAHIKASSLGREFSKSKLEAKLGEFEPLKIDIEAIKHYQAEPVIKLEDQATQKLWHDYKKAQSLTKEQKSHAIESAIAEKQDNTYQIFKSKLRPISANYKDEFEQMAQAMDLWRQRLYRKWEIDNQKYYQNLAIQKAKNVFKRTSWLEYVKNEALNGNAEALEVLRRRRKDKPILAKHNGFIAKTKDEVIAEQKIINNIQDKISLAEKGKANLIRWRIGDYQVGLSQARIDELTQNLKDYQSKQRFKRSLDNNIDIAQVDGITKNGTIIYNFKDSVIKDDGVSIVPVNSNTKTISNAIELIKQKRGQFVDINGDEAFKRKTIWASIKHRLTGFSFKDKNIETEHNQLIKDIVTGKITANYVAQKAGDYVPKKPKPKYITINLTEKQKQINQQLSYLNELANSSANKEKHITIGNIEYDQNQEQNHSQPTAQNLNEGAANTAGAEYITIRAIKPNTKINGYIKTAITK